MRVDMVLDVPFINLVLSTVILVEALMILVLRWTRPRTSSRAQAIVGFFAIVSMAVLGVLTGFGQVWQIHADEVFPALSAITAMAALLRVATVVLLTTFLWHEWKEDPDTKEAPDAVM